MENSYQVTVKRVDYKLLKRLNFKGKILRRYTRKKTKKGYIQREKKLTLGLTSGKMSKDQERTAEVTTNNTYIATTIVTHPRL